MDRRWRSKGTEGLVELGEKLRGWRLWNGQKFTWSGPKNHLGSGEANSLLGGGPEPEQDPGQLLVPRTISTASPEGVLHGAVEPLDHPITLGMVGSGLVMPRTAQGRCQSAETN